MPFPIGAAIGAGASLLGSIFSNSGARKRQELANAQNIEFWQMQNAYNHPSQQMARLKQAGLNPNLVYGGSTGQASGQASNIAPSKAAPYEIENPIRDIGHFANLAFKEAQENNVLENTKVQAQENLLKQAQTINVLEQGKSAKTKAMVDEAISKYQIDASREQLRGIKMANTGKNVDNLLKSATFNSKVNLIKEQVKHVQSQKQGQQLTNTLRELQVELKELGIEPTDNMLFRMFGQQWEKIKQFMSRNSKPKKLKL